MGERLPFIPSKKKRRFRRQIGMILGRIGSFLVMLKFLHLADFPSQFSSSLQRLTHKYIVSITII